MTIYDPMDCSLSGSPVHGILQARILEWVAIPFSWPRFNSWVSRIAGRFFTVWATKEAPDVVVVWTVLLKVLCNYLPW